MSTTSMPSASGEDNVGLPPSIGPASSPLWPKHLADLFVRPRSFFSSRLALKHTPNVLLVVWCSGISSAIDRIDRELMRADFGAARAGWDSFGPLLVGSWAGFWLWVLAFGALGGAVFWWVGGWWYRVRLGWSGARQADKQLARLTLAYSSFVFAGPAVIAAMIQTAVYPNYAAAYRAEEWFSSILLVFPFWSIAASYAGVTTLFPVTRWKAIIWFIVLPALVYISAYGLIAALVVFLGGGAG